MMAMFRGKTPITPEKMTPAVYIPFNAPKNWATNASPNFVSTPQYSQKELCI
jgi:hypothetical protein